LFQNEIHLAILGVGGKVLVVVVVGGAGMTLVGKYQGCSLLNTAGSSHFHNGCTAEQG